MMYLKSISPAVVVLFTLISMMVLSNKGMLPILWELYPNHEYLLKSYFGSAREMSTYARKPLLSREGANVFLTTNEGEIATGGLYGQEGYIYQELAPIPSSTACTR